jgi:hypothetical protein
MTSSAQVPEREPADETARRDDELLFAEAAQGRLAEQRSSPPPDEPVDPYAEAAAREQLLGPGDDSD